LAKLTGAGKQDRPSLSPPALTALRHYHFPGNVRELENILERALALYDGNIIEIDDLSLPKAVRSGTRAPEYDETAGSLEEHLERIEKQALTLALEANKWDKTAAAEQLGLSFRSLRYRLKQFDMDS
jgi:two-component system response regulator PilR (NtrC family)